MYFKFIYGILFLLLTTDLSSQTCCSAGAPISTFLDLATDEKTFSLQLNYEYNSINLLVDNDMRLDCINGELVGEKAETLSIIET